MAIIKCKMCGGDMELSADKTFGTCEYCGSVMTLPKVDDEQRAAAFNRGNHFRRIGEFDKALAVYERIVQEDETDAEAHWCCTLCRFGIEYVKDPDSGEYLPTCHRASFDSILEDVDYLAALQYADAAARVQYEKEGQKIDEVQRGILATSQREKPFDVFICYKETGKDGQRTIDSTLAQEIYYQLTEQGYRVFFARITLEDKGGVEFEPYIFAALHSARVMVVVSTKPQYANAAWVKNEWSRYLALMKKDRKRLLIPCYRDMDPYDLPEQLSILQSYDMSKIGFMQDLIRGISKVLDADKTPEYEKTIVQENAAVPGVESLLRRGELFLEDGDWESADEYFERVLDIEPECSQAYTGKLLAAMRRHSFQELYQYDGSNDPIQKIASNREYEKAVRFGGEKEKKRYEDLFDSLMEQRSAKCYEEALAAMDSADTCEKMREAQERFEALGNFRDAKKKADECAEAARLAQLETKYHDAEMMMENRFIDNKYERAAGMFRELGDYKDAKERAEECDRLEEERLRNIRIKEKQEAEEQAKKKRRKCLLTVLLILAAAVYFVVTEIIIPSNHYEKAMAFEEAGQYEAGREVFETLGDYKDSADHAKECAYRAALSLKHEGKRRDAIGAFMKISNYKDSRDQIARLMDQMGYREQVFAGSEHAVGLKADGTAIAVGGNWRGQCVVDEWQDIVQVCAGRTHTVGLKSDGTVVATGWNDSGECAVDEWRDIVQISAGKYHTVGLRANGTVEIVGECYYGCDRSCFDDWKDIVQVSTGEGHTAGLRSDGSVVAAGWNFHDECDVGEWQNIVQISAGTEYTVGLMADGTVVAVGENSNGQCDVSEWQDIVQISAGNDHTVGLKADGTVVDTGMDGDSLREWRDIVQVSAGEHDIIGLKSDGTVVTLGEKEYDGDASDWTNMKVPTMPVRSK